MLWTTVPAFCVALLFFSLIPSGAATAPEQIAELRAAISQEFNVGVGVLIPLAVMIGLIWKRVPAYPAIMLATLAGILTALTLQADVVRKFALMANPEATMPVVEGLWRTLFAGFEGTTTNEELNRLISKGGIASMLTRFG